MKRGCLGDLPLCSHFVGDLLLAKVKESCLLVHCEMWLLGGNHLLMEEELQKLTSQRNLKEFKVYFCHQKGATLSLCEGTKGIQWMENK